MKQRKVSGVLAAASVMMFISPVTADDNTATARLTGYQETPLTINSPGSGEFRARISRDEASIDFVLTYRDLSPSSQPTQAHIHFGRPATSGGVVFFLCTNGTPPAGVPVPQSCPAAPATITGTLTQLDVIPHTPDQGIDAGAVGFAEMVKAIRAGATYANVHTPTHPGGEIRGHIDDHRGDNHRDK